MVKVNPKKSRGWASRRKKSRRGKYNRKTLESEAMLAVGSQVPGGSSQDADPGGVVAETMSAPAVVDFDLVQVKEEVNMEEAVSFNEQPFPDHPQFERLDSKTSNGLVGSGAFSDPIRLLAQDQDPITGSVPIVPGSLDNPIRISGVNLALVTKNGTGSIGNPIRISRVVLPGGERQGTGSLDNPVKCGNISERGVAILNGQSLNQATRGRESGSSSSATSSLPGSAHAMARGNSVHRELLKYLTRKNEEGELSSNGHFLLSLEADLSSLTSEGQATFKKKVILMLQRMVNSGA